MEGECGFAEGLRRSMYELSAEGCRGPRSRQRTSRAVVQSAECWEGARRIRAGLQRAGVGGTARPRFGNEDKPELACSATDYAGKCYGGLEDEQVVAAGDVGGSGQE